MPKDDSKPYPILLTRSPFGIGPYGPDEYFPIGRQTEALLEAGYIFVRQDVRGRLMSEGRFTHVRPHVANKGSGDVDESTDTRDTIDWLLAHVPAIVRLAVTTPSLVPDRVTRNLIRRARRFGRSIVPRP